MESANSWCRIVADLDRQISYRENSEKPGTSKPPARRRNAREIEPRISDGKAHVVLNSRRSRVLGQICRVTEAPRAVELSHLGAARVSGATRHDWPRIISEIGAGYLASKRRRLSSYKLGMMIGKSNKTVEAIAAGSEPKYSVGEALLAIRARCQEENHGSSPAQPAHLRGAGVIEPI